MEQVSLRLIVQKDFQDVVENLFLDHVLDRHGVLGLNNCLEELDDLYIGLDRFVAVAVDNLEQDLLVHKEHAKLIRVNIVNDELVEELKD